ncbi:AVAST type 2 anti-phage system protein Avs2 [Pectobacterium carotovorum]|uniref:AVAST type 2 anti-phage system protein Avs2 n=1 Tax=Pectobacterium carotovorum TaxID=554 RepID=UPI000E75A6A9|nr:AVAST type 2 anti-phage system protein Avs2 [Pectobacterium carotovorum]RJL37288.1 ATP-binding protein [Pectobacterium carotovorum]UFT96059.1 ATP-binding protein [Pectobacterium carotovorum]
MDPISVTVVATYVATKFVDQFISEEGYGWIKKACFPKKKYINQLYKIIEETAIEFEKKHPVGNNKIPFYQSQPLFEILNEYILFKDLPNKDELLKGFDKYPNVIPPTQEQLEVFYGIFLLKINNCKTLKKLHIEETYKEKIFDISDELIQIKLLLQSLDEKMTFSLSDDWLNRRNREAVADLGGRYTPELNVKLEVSKIFEGIGRTQLFSDLFYKHIDDFLIKGKGLRNCDEISEKLFLIAKALTDITTLYLKIDFSNLREIPIDKFFEYILNCKNAISESESALWKIREESKNDGKEKDFIDNYSSIFRDLREFDYECENLCEFLKSITVNLSNNPFLLLEGDAGIGKSHLLADVIESRISLGYPSLFLLGQQLTTDESPWVQILKRLQLNNTSTEFLEKLNLYGKKKGKRFLIFIDAINEGNGNRFWEDNINSFVDGIKKFEWLGLIMSVRTTYKYITISKELVSRNNFEMHKHLGFKNVEMEAVNLFYDYYNIERPSSPNLNPEFKNPLFLKLLCEGIKKSGLTKVPVGFYGISKILSFFVEGVNKSLASPKKYRFDPGFRLVNDALNELIKVKLTNGGNNISLKDAQVVVQSVVQDYVSDKTFLSALIDEGVLTKGIIHNEDNAIEEVVYISFERFDDHLTVKHLLDGIENIEIEFKNGGSLKGYFNDEYDFYRNQGIVEALSIQLPEKYGKELYELLPEFRENHNLVDAFIDSLVWRDVAAIDLEKLSDFINENVLCYRNTFDHFLENLISISGVEGHPMNAAFLHNWLSKPSLADRDAFWTTRLKYKHDENSTFSQLIDWAWSDADKSYISDDSIELVATTLCWFLTSSNRKLRDCSTKALVNLLEERIPILIRIINKFEGVNDPYVWERVFAVALGCTLRTKNHEELSELAETVFAKVFKSEFVYPHILLRDYAREIIEYISYLGFVPEGLELSKTKPPYKSKWPENIPTKEELNLLYDKEEYWSLRTSIMGGGDFSRYTIGTNHNQSDWSGCQFGKLNIDRKQVFENFKSKLTVRQKELHDSTDPIIYDDGNKEISFGETTIIFSSVVGRKSEEEILTNKTAFKASLSKKLFTIFERDIEPYLDHNNNLLETDKHFDLRIAERLIFNRVINLGWDPKLHGNFDKNIGTGRGRRESFQERIGKKYQWISYYEYMAMLSDNFIRFKGYGKERKESPYQGPWEPYIRDIDPTILLKNTGTKEISHQEMWWTNEEVFDWNCTYEEWVSNSSTISNPYGLIEVNDNNDTKWLVLESYPSWKEPKVIGHKDWGYPRKEVWCHVKGYLVKSEEFENIKNWAKDQHYMGNWMPEGSSRYQLFHREFYWSEAFNFFKSDYYGSSDWSSVTDPESGAKIADVSVTSINYLWEEEFDKSKTNALNFLKPSFLIFDKMGLKNGKIEGSYEDKDGNIICFAAEALNKAKTHLLIKKEPFLRMLNENNLDIVWTLLGEKGVIGGSLSSNHHYGRIEFSGSFYLNNGELNGANKIYLTR